MSLRKRIRACSNGSRATERTGLEQIWRENRSAWQDLSSQWNPVLEPIERTLQEMRNAGFSDLVCDLARIAFVKKDFAFYQNAVMALSRMGLDKKDWREKLKSELLPSDRRLDLVRVLAASIEIEAGASERQAAERAAAMFGAGASFNAAAQGIRENVRDPRMVREAEELLRRHIEDNQRKADDTSV